METKGHWPLSYRTGFQLVSQALLTKQMLFYYSSGNLKTHLFCFKNQAAVLRAVDCYSRHAYGTIEIVIDDLISYPITVLIACFISRTFIPIFDSYFDV